MKDIPLNERIIFALDFDSHDVAKEWVMRLESHVKFYKVGLQLFLSDWFRTIDWIVDRGHKVMVDLKFFDIPETVSLAVKALSKKRVAFATVHGNKPILEAAVSAKNGIKILAVTVLTSFGPEDMFWEFGVEVDVKELVLVRARRALSLGCDGVISSGLEAQSIRQELGENFLIVTPGIRPWHNVSDHEKDDQKRVTTALDAVRNGADYIVVGRPISTAEDPLAVVELMQKEIIQAIQ
jgi:orotidine-5'-phosphate decarboxylase